MSCTCREARYQKILGHDNIPLLEIPSYCATPVFYNPRRGSEVVLFIAECLTETSLIFQIRLDCHTVVMNTVIYDASGRGACVRVCVCVCPHDNVKKTLCSKKNM